MTATFVRGACPRLAAPMETGDGLLARLVPAGPIGIEALIGVCAAADTHGNGLIEISARGSLQVRGLTTASAQRFARTVEALPIALCGTVPVLASPLPDDPTAALDAAALAAAIREAIAASGLTLAPKLSVVVDGGGALHLDALTADIRLRAVDTHLLVSLAGDAATATPLGAVAPDDAPSAVLRLLEVIAAHDRTARAKDVLLARGLAPFRAAVDGMLRPAPALAARATAETIGLHRLKGGLCAIGFALPFGQAQASDLIALLEMARANGARWAALAPNRTLLLGPIGEMTGFVLATAADDLGFVVDARDARRRVVACAGAPACASGLLAARTLAAEIARALPPAQSGIAVHVSGCAKGCAHPSPAPLTLVGTPQGCAIVPGGTARGRASVFVSADNLVATAVHLIQRESVDA